MIRSLSLMLLGLLAVMPAAAATRSDSIRARLLNPDNKSVIVASHRADWRNFPENSLEGIESAIAMGVDIVELDVHMTKDSVLILMHDSTLDRTSTGHGKISNATLEEIKALNLKNGCNIRTIHKP
ncbi:MAG: glycerophosphodiester phosphodiesterase family protein, partial [Muribaculaceae bacterium]|nr:glycerophosphodiester phosphodiesterase family protein [Muribaculaceae bacterium]